MQILVSILLVFSLILCGVIIGMNLVHKMYEKTINEQQDLISEYKELTETLKDRNSELAGIITDVLNENDYASASYIKEQIKKTLGSAGKHKS